MRWLGDFGWWEKRERIESFNSQIGKGGEGGGGRWESS